MKGRIAVVTLLAAGLAATAARAQIRPAVDRPDIIEIGDPILINRQILGLEMRRNTDLRDWVGLYGAPDYAEVQEIQIEPPWASYEVRLYYLDRNAYLAFGRVHVSPSVYDYGVRKYIGSISPAVLTRLLTAKPVEAAPSAAVPAAAEAAPAPAEVGAAAVVIETVPVEGVPISN